MQWLHACLNPLQMIKREIFKGFYLLHSGYIISS